MNLSYKNKYLKYKNKYLTLKNQKGGHNEIIGINFEAGKIINHILEFPNCIAYANIQIAMDAPYHGRVAPETIRAKGRSETQFPCYNEKYLLLQLEKVFAYIKDNYKETKIIIQIARGRAARSMFDEVINPLITYIGITDVVFVNGYRSEDYFAPSFGEPFVFVNIGMFAVLRNVEMVQVAEIVNPNRTIVINSYDVDTKRFNCDYTVSSFDDSKNILNHLPFFSKITLAGIADDMKFVTNDVYDKDAIDDMIQQIDKII
jgi:hypothetical protein